MTENLPNLKENIQEINSTKFKQGKHKMFYTQIHHSKNAESQTKGKCGSSRVKELITYKGAIIRTTAKFSSEIRPDVGGWVAYSQR